MGSFSWRFPSSCGDFALTGAGVSEDGTKTIFKVIGADLIPSERASIAVFLEAVEAKGWSWSGHFDQQPIKAPTRITTAYKTAVILIEAPVGVDYPAVALLLSTPTVGVLGTFTAVRLTDGTVYTSGANPAELSAAAADQGAGLTWWQRVKRFFSPLPQTEGSFAAAAQKMLGGPAEPVAAPPALLAPPPSKPPEPVVAVTTSRPTNCCPYTIPGDTRGRRADKLLLAFCTAEQRETWIKYGWLEARGRITGDRYRVAHRHSPIARKQTKVTWLLDSDQVVHAHATWLPPAEEVLTLKLVIEGHESWVRNPSTVFGIPSLPHPFQSERTQSHDGLTEAAFVSGLAPFVGIPVPPEITDEY